ncbi:MAG: response regulator transcription factor [Chloroflexi bacterium]|nr:response regulator transcription factor [Chloroflexota bacterium]
MVEDNDAIRNVLQRTLGTQYEVVEAATARQALRSFYEQRPDLVLLDIGLPDLTGWEVLHRFREMADTPVIMLTGRDNDADVVRSLQEGADDYVTKPFSAARLAARIEAVLRRARRPAGAETERIELDGGWLVVDRAARQAIIGNEVLDLTSTEYRVLELLASRAGQVLAPSEILAQVWGAEYVAELDYVKTYVRRLRAKIEPNPRRPTRLISRRGLGYVLVRSLSPATSDP